MIYGLLNAILCFLLCVLLVPVVRYVVKKLGAGQNILEYVEEHKAKQGTPTMGGVAFLLSMLIGYFVFCARDYNMYSLVAVISACAFGLIGLLDDFIKVRLKHNMGLRAYQKFGAQLALGIIIAIFVYKSEMLGSIVLLPGGGSINIGLWVVPLIVLVYLALSNSVNLLDGLDGLSGSVTSVVVLVYTICMFVSCVGFSDAHSMLMQNLVIFSMGAFGAIIGFLIYNSNPASIFMGDVGSLGLGGLVASMMVLSRQYVLIFIVGAMYIVTTMSVILQVISFKLTKKRIFKMAPFHHHLQQSGVKECKITAFYFIVTVVLGMATIVIYVM